jgi:hypothetical protein
VTTATGSRGTGLSGIGSAGSGSFSSGSALGAGSGVGVEAVGKRSPAAPSGSLGSGSTGVASAGGTVPVRVPSGSEEASVRIGSAAAGSLVLRSAPAVAVVESLGALVSVGVESGSAAPVCVESRLSVGAPLEEPASEVPEVPPVSASAGAPPELVVEGAPEVLVEEVESLEVGPEEAVSEPWRLGVAVSVEVVPESELVVVKEELESVEPASGAAVLVESLVRVGEASLVMVVESVLVASVVVELASAIAVVVVEVGSAAGVVPSSAVASTVAPVTRLALELVTISAAASIQRATPSPAASRKEIPKERCWCLGTRANTIPQLDGGPPSECQYPSLAVHKPGSLPRTDDSLTQRPIRAGTDRCG